MPAPYRLALCRGGGPGGGPFSCASSALEFPTARIPSSPTPLLSSANATAAAVPTHHHVSTTCECRPRYRGGRLVARGQAGRRRPRQQLDPANHIRHGRRCLDQPRHQQHFHGLAQSVARPPHPTAHTPVDIAFLAFRCTRVKNWARVPLAMWCMTPNLPPSLTRACGPIANMTSCLHGLRQLLDIRLRHSRVPIHRQIQLQHRRLQKHDPSVHRFLLTHQSQYIPFSLLYSRQISNVTRKQAVSHKTRCCGHFAECTRSSFPYSW